MSLLARDFDVVFNELLNKQSYNTKQYVKYHTSKNENEFLLEIPLPGTTKNDVEVSVEKETLSVKVKKNQSRFSKEYNHMWLLSEEHNVDDVSAIMENGVLTVKIGRVKPQKKVVSVTVV